MFAVKDEKSANVTVDGDNKDALIKILFNSNNRGHTMEKYAELLAKDDCGTSLDFLSIFLASTWKRKKIKKGNVCIALAGIDKTMFIASNINDDAGDISCILGDTTTETLSFLHLFETDLFYRMKVVSTSTAKEYLRKYISEEVYQQFTIIENFQNVVTRINELYPPRQKSTNEIKDSVVASFCDIVYLWDQVKQPKHTGFIHTMLMLEIIASSSTSVYSTNERLLEETENLFFTDLLRYSVETIFEAFLDTGFVFQSNELLHIILFTQSKQRISNLKDSICKKFENITSKYKLVDQLKNSIRCLDDYEQYVYVVDANPNQNGVLHCEIKLYLYLQQQNQCTNIPFSISKPLGMDCAMYFFSHVSELHRPIFRSACTDHYSNVLFRWSCASCDNLWSKSHGVNHLHAGIVLFSN